MVRREEIDPRSSIRDLLAYYLHFLRMKHGLSCAKLGEKVNAARQTVSHWESGLLKPNEYQIRELDRLYGTGDMLFFLWEHAKTGHDSDWRERRARHQREAIEHYLFSGSVVPVPFQTEDYARCLLRAGYAAGLIADVEEAVRERMTFQAAILDGGPQIWAVVDEVALRPMGPPDVMAAQREHLIEMGTLPNVSFRVLPLSAAPHIGLEGSFWCFTLPGRRLAAFSGNTLGVGKVFDDQAEAAVAVVRFQRIAARAWSEDQSRELMARMGETDAGGGVA